MIFSNQRILFKPYTTDIDMRERERERERSLASGDYPIFDNIVGIFSPFCKLISIDGCNLKKIQLIKSFGKYF